VNKTTSANATNTDHRRHPGFFICCALVNRITQKAADGQTQKCRDVSIAAFSSLLGSNELTRSLILSFSKSLLVTSRETGTVNLGEVAKASIVEEVKSAEDRSS